MDEALDPPGGRVVPVPRHVVLVSLCPCLALEPPFPPLADRAVNVSQCIWPISENVSSNKVHDKENRFWARLHSGFAHTSCLYEPLESIGAFWVSRPCKVFGAAWPENFQLGISALESLRVNGETLVRVNI